MLKQDLILQIMNQTYHYLKEKIQKVIGVSALKPKSIVIWQMTTMKLKKKNAQKSVP